MLVVIFISVVFTSCQKEEVVMPIVTEPQPVKVTAQTINIDAIRAQLTSFSDMTTQQVTDSLKAKSGLKSGQLTHNRAKTVNSRNYYVQDDQAVKVYDYLKTDMNGYWNEELTVYQLFSIINGVVDSTTYRLKYEVGPPSGSRTFYIESDNYLNRVACHFHANNGSQTDYYIAYNGNNRFTLPDYTDGYWQLVFYYYINGVLKTYVSNPIDYDASSNELTLMLQFDDVNTVASIEMTKNLIIGADRIEVQGYDENGIYQYMTIPVTYSDNMPNIISYDLPIDPSFMYVCGENFCNFYEAKIVRIKLGNISVFNLVQKW